MCQSKKTIPFALVLVVAGWGQSTKTHKDTAGEKIPCVIAIPGGTYQFVDVTEREPPKPSPEPNYWTTEAGAAYVCSILTLIATIYLVIRQINIAKRQNEIQESMKTLQVEMNSHQKGMDAWQKLSIEATLFEKLHSDVIDADQQFQWKYLIPYDPFNQPEQENIRIVNYNANKGLGLPDVDRLRIEQTVLLFSKLDRLCLFMLAEAITNETFKRTFDEEIPRLRGYYSEMEHRVTNIYYKHWLDYAATVPEANTCAPPAFSGATREHP